MIILPTKYYGWLWSISKKILKKENLKKDINDISANKVLWLVARHSKNKEEKIGCKAKKKTTILPTKYYGWFGAISKKSRKEEEE